MKGAVLMVTIKPKLVIFDMDGTMLDTEPISLQGMYHAAEVKGVTMPLEFYQQFLGRNVAHARMLIQQRFGDAVNFDEIAALHQNYIDDYIEKNGLPIKKGLHGLLDKLESSKINKCVATSTAKALAINKLTTVGIIHRFGVLVCGDEVTESKPNPEIFLKAAALCKTAPAESLVIEDSIAGAVGAYRAGIPYILVPCIAPLTDEVKQRARAVCKDLDAVREMIA